MKGHSTPLRTCILTGEELSVFELIRFVKGPKGEIFPDPWNKLPGRGAWVKANKDLIFESLKNGQFEKMVSKSFKEGVKVIGLKEEFLEKLEKALVKRSCELLGLEKKSGRLISGFEKVSKTMKTQNIAFLLSADDAGEDGIEKLKALARHQESQVFYVNAFGREELSDALGAENIVHVGILLRGISARIKEEVLRLASFRGKSVQVFGGKI